LIYTIPGVKITLVPFARPENTRLDNWYYLYCDFVCLYQEDGTYAPPQRRYTGLNKHNVTEEFDKTIDDVFKYCNNVLLIFDYLVNTKLATIEKVSSSSGANRLRKNVNEDGYHRLVLSNLDRETCKAGGTHASPREHIRRGFWRTSKLGKRHWVPDTIVMKGAQYKIKKDYVVK
jgi:hypothetical protein